MLQLDKTAILPNLIIDRHYLIEAMTEHDNAMQAMYKGLKERFDSIPFNKAIGMEISHMEPEKVEVSIEMRDDLVGNEKHRMLHGGVICAVLDAAGGAMTMVGAFNRMLERQASEEEFGRLMSIGTINLHVDFLRPGKGNHFVCTGRLLRAGGKVLSIRLELHNEEGELIASGSGSFLH